MSTCCARAYNSSKSLHMDVQYLGSHFQLSEEICLTSIQDISFQFGLTENLDESHSTIKANYVIWMYGADKLGTRVLLDVENLDFTTEDNKTIFILKLTGNCLLCNYDFTINLTIKLDHKEHPTPVINSVRFDVDTIIKD